MEKKVTPGIHPYFQKTHFSDEELRIINYFSSELYITNGGQRIAMGINSQYNYFLFKPSDSFSNQFNIDKEIITLFSKYEDFEPRTLDAYDKIEKELEEYRTERVCYVLISKDENIKNKLSDLINTDPESPNIIPFTYKEIINNFNNYLIRNRFRDFLYSRDLFDFSGPLKKDLFFYGRTEIINDAINRHNSGENFGIFGLRRTGKTSIAYGVIRAAKKLGTLASFIDCQNTSFNQRRWHEALFYVIHEIKEQNNLDIDTLKESDYSIKNAGISFEKDLLKISKKTNKKIIIIFDEIERITFDISIVEHWKDGNDFLFFWQTVRSIYQKNNIFTFIICGTNPKCLEAASINKTDNPIFNQVSFKYVPGFTINQTREMVRKLGRIMGIGFDELIYSKFADDYGGHPFLIRHLCSFINKKIKDRPFIVDKKSYSDFQIEFALYDSGFCPL